MYLSSCKLYFHVFAYANPWCALGSLGQRISATMTRTTALLALAWTLFRRRPTALRRASPICPPVIFHTSLRDVSMCTDPEASGGLHGLSVSCKYIMLSLLLAGICARCWHVGYCSLLFPLYQHFERQVQKWDGVVDVRTSVVRLFVRQQDGERRASRRKQKGRGGVGAGCVPADVCWSVTRFQCC